MRISPTNNYRALLLLLLSRFSHVRLCATPQTATHQASRPWDSPGKNTGVGCHFLLQWMKVKSESEVAQLCPNLCNPMDRSLPGFCVHEISQARILEWVVISSTRGSSAPRDQTQVSSNSCLGRRVLLPLRHVESPKNKHYSLTLWIKVMKNSCWTLFFLHYDY